MPKTASIRIACLAGLTLLLQAGPSQAQVAVANMPALEATGYALMDNLNTPLLHHVATGASYDLRVLALGDPDDRVPGPHDAIRRKAASNNEFERQEVIATWGSFVARRVQDIQGAHAYLIPLDTRWVEYDFATHRYRTEFTMAKRGWRTKATFHCAGAYQQASRYEYLTACLTATNLNNGDASLQYFPMDDVGLARQIKDNPGRFRVYGLAEPNGRYQVLKGNEIRYMPGDIFRASGVQPVKIVNLALVERTTGAIYAFAQPLAETHSQPAQAVPNSGQGNALQSRPDSAIEAPSKQSLRWLKYSHTNQASFYVDPDSIKRDGDVVLVREMTDYAKVGDDRTASVVGIYAYNCAKRSARRLGLKAYADHKGRGEMLGEFIDPQDMGTIEVGTVSDLAYNVVCNAASAAP